MLLEFYNSKKGQPTDFLSLPVCSLRDLLGLLIEYIIKQLLHTLLY